MSEEKSQPIIDKSLAGEKLYLRPMDIDDVTICLEWYTASDPLLLGWRPQPILTANTAVEDFKDEEVSDRQQRFMIVRRKDDELVGQIRYFDLNTLNRSAELEILLNPEARGKKHGSEALYILSRYLFRQRGLNKVYIRVSSLNSPGIGFLESSGFKRDGAMRHHHFYKGEFHDQFVYSLLLYEFEG